MPSYSAPLKDFNFVLLEFLRLDKYSNLEGFDEASPDIVLAILDEGAKLASEVFQPINLSGDEEGCHWKNGEVQTPQGFQEAYGVYRDGGWQGLTAPTRWGGQGLPYVLGLPISEMLIAANWGLSMYPFLTRGAIDAIEAHGDEAIKERFLPKMVAGAWAGTMNLTEPHAGTDLGIMRTKAEPQGDGTYLITGTKIFISSGEHDLTENIIHLVLARIPGGPPGSKGISLFLVPKFIPDESDAPGERNHLSCGAIEEKMGIHSNATCVMNFDGAVGYLIGEEHRGLPAMFTMMNEARLGVGIQGLAVAEAAYQNAARYACERLQGRALSGKQNPDGPADPIIVHPDVRRMLMTGKAFIEGARALAAWTGLQADLAHRHPEADIRTKAEDFLGIMTPVVKAYFTDMGFEIANLALQTYGGHGYIREHGMEQYVRDARIGMIYEGTNGVQAMDLVGRKLPAAGGRAIQALFKEIEQEIDAARQQAGLESFALALEKSLERLQRATLWLMQNATSNPENAGAAAFDYLRLVALTSMGWAWLRMAGTAKARLGESPENPTFYEEKLSTAKFFFERMLVDTSAHLERVQAGAESTMALPANAF